MLKTIPLETLNNPAEISNICHETNEPVFLMKNDEPELVIMSMKTYNNICLENKIDSSITESEKDYEAGNLNPTETILKFLREKYFGSKH